MKTTHPAGKAAWDWGSRYAVNQQTEKDPSETKTYQEGKLDSELDSELYCYFAW